MARPGIMVYFDMLGPISALPDREKGQLLVAMLQYGQDGTLPKFKGTLAVVWGFVQPKLDRDSMEYEKTVQKRQYATFCRTLKKKGLPEVSFDDWLSMSDTERYHMISHDTTWYPTTTVTPTTNTTGTTTAAVATTGTTTGTDSPDGDLMAAAAERKRKKMNGELGRGLVFLSEYQIDRLLLEMGIDNFDYYVKRLADFIQQNDAHVQNHYTTILKWFEEDSSV